MITWIINFIKNIFQDRQDKYDFIGLGIPQPFTTFETMKNGKKGCNHKFLAIPWDDRFGPDITDMDKIEKNYFARCTYHYLLQCEKCGKVQHKKTRALI